MRGDVELAKMLLYAGATLKAATRLEAYTPLLVACEQGDAAMIQTLLMAGAHPNSSTTSGASALMLAALSDSAEAVSVLLDHGAHIDGREAAHGQTALMFAAAAGRSRALVELLDRGADTSLTTHVVDSVERERTTRAARKLRRERAKLGASVEPSEDAEEFRPSRPCDRLE